MKFPYPEKHSFQLREIVEESLRLLRGKYKKITFQTVDDLAAPLTITGDVQPLKDILQISMINAAEFTGASNITVTARQLLQSGNEVLLEFNVIDNGIKAENVKNQNLSYEKTFIAAKSLVEKQGGKAQMISMEGVGSTFKFLIQYRLEEKSEKKAPVPSSPKTLSGKKILIAEDNEFNQKIIAHVLKKESIEVDIASDGKEVMELFEKNNDYDLLLLDLQMPYINGLEAANYIRKKLKRNLPIIALTAGGYPDDQARCFEAGINQYIKKPFKQEELLNHIYSYLKG